MLSLLGYTPSPLTLVCFYPLTRCLICLTLSSCILTLSSFFFPHKIFQVNAYEIVKINNTFLIDNMVEPVGIANLPNQRYVESSLIR